jgi:hypothetical protein
MLYLFLIGTLIGLQDAVPYKNSDDFELTMSYQFKSKLRSNTEVNLNTTSPSTTPRPYLYLTLKINSLNQGEARIRIVDNLFKVILNKKVVKSDDFELDMGFTDDMKDRTTAHEITVYFLSADKKETISRILIHVAEDGSFFVNEEKRGKL